jgi:SAM-dependent methyltransferase
VDDLAGRVDLVVAIAMVHELPDRARFFAEVRHVLAPGGEVLLVEPAGHVTAAEFEVTLSTAERAGLRRSPGPPLARRRTALLA